MSATRSSPTLPFERQTNHRHGVRAVVTGQVGLEKRHFLEQVVSLGRKHGREIHLFNVGEMMCREAPDVVPRRILDLSRHRLTSIRRSVFKDILRAAATGIDMIVSTHATFRWKHGLFHAYDDNQMRELDANLYVTLVDNVDAVHERLQRDHEIRHSLKDILVWREEEIVVTEAMAEGIAGYGHAYVLSRGDPEINVRALYRLMFEPHRKRVYPSFPMTHVMNLPETLHEIESFRDVLAEHFITFDPADLDEKRLLADASEATRRGDEFVTLNVHGHDVVLSVDEINRIGHDIDAQIYARDFKLIDQSDMIVSYIPELPGGRPGISSGVERELQHAFEGTKEVYVVWRSREEPSPFITETASGIFASVQELFQFFQEKGYVAAFQLGL
ncbi:MAG: hypothetical protein HY287_13435 [Planctomycetes bacterium]|nr:hypothetical protein [Planctomycetota bacterium]MBI3835325.1 hypothetical protein [Planctomycetota bacterium]